MLLYTCDFCDWDRKKNYPMDFILNTIREPSGSLNSIDAAFDMSVESCNLFGLLMLYYRFATSAHSIVFQNDTGADV